MHTSEGESDSALGGRDIVGLEDPALGPQNEEEPWDARRGEGKLLMGGNVTFDISGFAVGREVGNLVAKEDYDGREDYVEDQGLIFPEFAHIKEILIIVAEGVGAFSIWRTFASLDVLCFEMGPLIYKTQYSTYRL